MRYANQNSRQHLGRLSQAEMLVLATVRRAGKADREYIAHRLDMSPSYVDSIVRLLSEGGYLIRVDNPGSRKALYRAAESAA